MASDLFNSSTALFSECGKYRYTLTRTWEEGVKPVVFCMLNPSRATEIDSDNTVTRCIDFAHRWGFGGLVVVNVYAYRSPYPEDLWQVEDPVGPDNDQHLVEQTDGRCVIAAWGNNAKVERARHVYQLIRPGAASIQALKLTGSGQPYHPLYMAATTIPIPFSGDIR